MIYVKNSEQIEKMKLAGRITGEAILLAGEAVKEGVSTAELDRIIRHHIEKCGAKPSFLGYGGFPGSACISINDEVIHGIPSPKKYLKEGDIVKIDVGAFIGGYHGDSANTFPVGKVSDEALRLIEVTKESFRRGVEQAVIRLCRTRCRTRSSRGPERSELRDPRTRSKALPGNGHRHRTDDKRRSSRRDTAGGRMDRDNGGQEIVRAL